MGEQISERKKIEEAEQAKERERDANRAVAAKEARKKRETQHKKEEQAADAKRRQQEKREKERAIAKDAKKTKAEHEDKLLAELQQEDAKNKSAEQSAKDAAKTRALREEQNIEHIAQLLEYDYAQRLPTLDVLSNEDLLAAINNAVETDPSLRGSLELLHQAKIGEDQRRDCLMVLLIALGPVWHLALAPPADVKVQSAIRNKVKKARMRLRDVAWKAFGTFPSKFGVDAVSSVTS